MLEAMYCATYAALPNRLSYPELLSDELYRDCRYGSEAELAQRLRWAVKNPDAAREVGRRLSQEAMRFDWRHLAPVYDAEFERLR